MSQEPHSLLWSKKANCFHIEPLAETEKSGMHFFLHEKTNDDLLLAHGSWDEMSRRADELRHYLNSRESARRFQDFHDELQHL